MNSIQNNPFRIIGIPANASAKDIQSRKGKVQAFTRVGKEVPSEFDFPFFEKINRDETLLNKAYSNIEHNNEKVLHALFWFTKVNSFDEMALKYLENDDVEKAKEIWKKISWDKEVTSSNWSAFNNISTLLLWYNDDDFAEEEFDEVISTKVKFIRSDYYNDFVLAVADQTYSVSPERQIEIYLDTVLKELKNDGFTSSAAIQLFENCDVQVKNYVVKGFTADKIVQIEHELEVAKKQRDSKPGNAYNSGKALHLKSKPILDDLKASLGVNDANYQRLAESLAKELRQSGITYFNEWQETKDPSKESMELLNKAYAIAINKMTKESIADNYKGMQEFGKTQLIKKDLDVLAKLMTKDNEGVVPKHKLYRFNDGSIDTSTKLINNALPHLLNVKAVLKGKSEMYMIISTNIAAKALDNIIETVNNHQQPNLIGQTDLSKLKRTLSDAWEATALIEKLDMLPQFQSNFDKNKNSLKNLCSQLDVSTPQKNYSKIPELNFIITGSEIKNSEEKNNFSNEKNLFFEKFVRYIKLNLDIVCFSNENVELFLKYINPKGQYKNNNSTSPDGFTYSEVRALTPGTKTLNLVGWGNSQENTYQRGTHRIELWVQNFKIYEDSFNIKQAPSEQIQEQLTSTESEFTKIQNTNYFQTEIMRANGKLGEINQFKMFRSGSKKQEEINEQQRIIDNLKNKAKSEKESQLRILQAKIDRLKQELSQAKY